MNILIIPENKVEEIKSMNFEGGNILEPIKFNDIYFLNAELKNNPLFSNALNGFEIKEIDYKPIKGVL